MGWDPRVGAGAVYQLCLGMLLLLLDVQGALLEPRQVASAHAFGEGYWPKLRTATCWYQVGSDDRELRSFAV